MMKNPAEVRAYLTEVLVALKGAAAEPGNHDDITPNVIHRLREQIGVLLKGRWGDEQTEDAFARHPAVEAMMPGKD